MLALLIELMPDGINARSSLMQDAKKPRSMAGSYNVYGMRSISP